MLFGCGYLVLDVVLVCRVRVSVEAIYAPEQPTASIKFKRLLCTTYY